MIRAPRWTWTYLFKKRDQQTKKLLIVFVCLRFCVPAGFFWLDLNRVWLKPSWKLVSGGQRRSAWKHFLPIGQQRLPRIRDYFVNLKSNYTFIPLWIWLQSFKRHNSSPRLWFGQLFSKNWESLSFVVGVNKTCGTQTALCLPLIPPTHSIVTSCIKKKGQYHKMMSTYIPSQCFLTSILKPLGNMHHHNCVQPQLR